MPLLLRSMPLALRTFWRYLLLLPVLAVVAIVVSLIAALIPFASLLVPGTISAFLVVMGLRCALSARGRPSEQAFGQLLYISVLFCIINAVAFFAIDLIGVGIVWVLANAGGLNVQETVARGLAWSPFWISVGLIGILPPALYGSLMAVPMTAAVASESSRTSFADVFFGFGSGLISLGLIMLIWLGVGHFFAIFGEVWTMFAMIISALFALMRADDVPWDWSFSMLSLMGSTLFMTLASSWFYATAVLAWEDANQRQNTARTKNLEASRVSGDSLRTLREARAQELRGGGRTTS